MSGRCRVCGCNDAERCEVGRVDLPDVDDGPICIRDRQMVWSCQMVGSDICSRCHSIRNLTIGQEAELERIGRLHDVTVIPTLHRTGLDRGRLVVTVTPRTLDELIARKHTRIVMVAAP